MKNKWKCIFLAYIMLLAIGCSDDDNIRFSTSIVEYDGTNLIVRDEVYPRADGIEKVDNVIIHGSLEYAAGEILIVFDNDKIDLIVSLLDLFDLSVDKETSSGQTILYTVSVPELFEEQWVEALAGESGVVSAELNSIVHTN